MTALLNEMRRRYVLGPHGERVEIHVGGLVIHTMPANLSPQEEDQQIKDALARYAERSKPQLKGVE